MASLTSDQIDSLSAQWDALRSALKAYRDAAADPHLDTAVVDGWIQQAAQIATNFDVAAMTADFADSADAFKKLQNVLTQANGYIAVLKAKQASWNRFSAVATALLSLVNVLGGPAGGILKCATDVAKAYTGNAGATADDSAPAH